MLALFYSKSFSVSLGMRFEVNGKNYIPYFSKFATLNMQKFLSQQILQWTFLKNLKDDYHNINQCNGLSYKSKKGNDLRER